MAIKCIQPKEFTIRLSECGVDTCRGSYKTMKEKDALKLALIVNHTMNHDFVDDKHRQLFQYHLACKLLKEVLAEGFNADPLIKDIKEADKFMDKWKLKQEEKQIKNGL